MSMMEQEQPEAANPIDIDGGADESGLLHLSEKAESETPTIPDVATTPITVAPRSMDRAGTAEHLAARRPITPPDADAPEIKQRLSDLRSEITTLLTDLRWGGASIDHTTTQMIPLLDVGPFLQWKAILIPFLYEIDRAGNLIPIWFNIITREDEATTPVDANEIETPLGRAKRTAILMLGNYKYVNISAISNNTYTDLSSLLGKLSVDPTTSLYATQSLVQQNTTNAIQALVGALKNAEGWAKVDVVDACLALNLTRFHEVLLASAFDHVTGLESYVAIPLYRAIPLEKYLLQENQKTSRLSQQAARIFAQVIQDSTTPPANTESETLPPVFERPLATYAHALFEGARRVPTWEHSVAVHRLAILMGRYWSDISRGVLQDTRIIEPIYACLPLMPDVERWMDGPGRDILLKTINEGEEESFAPVVKVLGELRDPRAISALLRRIEATRDITNREQALSLGAVCDTAGRLGDRRAVAPMQQLVYRVVPLSKRSGQPKRRDNLLPGDPDIPGSIVYGAVVRSCGLLGDRSSLDLVLQAVSDFDPYVRTQAIEALKHIEGAKDDARSRIAVREALNDPRDTVVRTACQLSVQFHDTDAAPLLRNLVQARPELAPAAYDALRQLGQ